MEPVISRESIARLADAAAQRWVANPASAKPSNPFNRFGQPCAHAAWHASFERFLVLHSAPEGEASA